MLYELAAIQQERHNSIRTCANLESAFIIINIGRLINGLLDAPNSTFHLTIPSLLLLLIVILPLVLMYNLAIELKKLVILTVAVADSS